MHPFSVNNDSQMALAIRIVEAHSLKALAFTNGPGFGYGQFMIQSIMHQ